MKFFPVVLKQLFDEELIEEDVFFEWVSSGVVIKNDVRSRHPINTSHQHTPLTLTPLTHSYHQAADLTRNEFSANLTMIDIDTLEALKASASLFITWLQEAEEEGEEGEEDGDEEEEEEEDA